ncbi:hypothetical protein VM95_24770 [Streptomyces rubellomurinus]|uniref:PhoU domain-containing protein n=2 Tax=Streptomyces rubellomurinus (strain ATCC 31215) TaxID=359131 RepID=A0A0F2TBK0_STRR3|nr:hypothetical protein VM95_24770 [Streptomyces rubellomurinus]
MSGGPHGEHRALIGELAALVRLAHTALRAASAVLTDPEDPGGGDTGIPTAEKALAELRERIEEDAAAVVPGGPTGLVLGVHVGCEVEALGQLVQRLLEAAWARQEREPFAERLRTPLRGLAGAAVELVARAADALESGAPEDIADVLARLPEVGRRQRGLYELLLAPETDGGTDPVDTADLVLLSCCYQQCADRAAAVVRHTGLLARAAR